MRRAPRLLGIPWLGALLLVAVTLAVQLSAMIGLAALRAAKTGELGFAEAFGAVQQDLVSVASAQLVAMGAAIVTGLALFDPDRKVSHALHLAPVRPASLGLCFAAGLGLQFPLSELSNVLHDVLFGPLPMEVQLHMQRLFHPQSLWQGMTLVLAMVGVAPVMEELLFRGQLLFGLRQRYGVAVALPLSAVLFGVCHLDAAAAVYASVGGLLLGWLALYTGSTLPSIALHAGINAVPVLLPRRLYPIPGFNVPSPTVQHMAWPWVVGGLTAGALALVWALRIGYVREQA